MQVGFQNLKNGSYDEIERVCTLVKGMDRCDFIISVGGGKAVDLGKGVATVVHDVMLY